MRRSLAITILVAVMAIGLFLRVNYLTEQSLWLDEGITYYNSSGDNLGEVWDKTARLDQSPPGYYFLMHGVLEVFGENEFVFRFISVIFGVLSILVLYLLLAAIFNQEVGLIGAALLAFNSFHIGFSMEARMYVLLSLEALCAFYFLYRAMMDPKRGYLWWSGLILTLIAGLYTHNFFFFVIAALGMSLLILLFGARKKLIKFFLGVLTLLIAFVAYLPWIPSLLYQLSTERYWMGENSLWDLKNYSLDFVNGNFYLLAAMGILAAVGIVWSLMRKKQLGISAILVFFAVGFGVPLLYSILIEPILKIRYVVYLVPFFLALAAVGIYSLRRFGAILAILVIGGYVFVQAPWQISRYPEEFGENYRGVIENLKSDAAVIVHSPSIKHVLNFYNQEKFVIHAFPDSDDLREYNIGFKSAEDFRTLIRNFEKFYLVISHTHENPPGLLLTLSSTFCSKVDRGELSGIEIYYFSDCK